MTLKIGDLETKIPIDLVKRLNIVRFGVEKRDLDCFIHYHGTSWRSRNNFPAGPPSGKVASHTAVSAPSWTVRGASGPPMRVLTHPGHILLTRILLPASSAAN